MAASKTPKTPPLCASCGKPITAKPSRPAPIGQRIASMAAQALSLLMWPLRDTAPDQPNGTSCPHCGGSWVRASFDGRDNLNVGADLQSWAAVRPGQM